MKTTVLVTCLFVTEVFSQGGFNNLRIPNLFSSGGNSGFSFSNLFRPNNNRQRQQRPQDGSSVQPFLSPPAPSTQIQTFLPQQPQNLPPLFNPQASQPVITNPQAIIPPQPLPLENSRQPIPFQQQAVQPPQQPQFPVQQQVNPNFLQGVQQFRPETGFTPVSPQIIGARQPVSLQPSFAGTAGVKQVFSPIENEIITRPDPTRGIGNFQDLRRRPSLKEKAYLDCGPGNDLGFCAVSEKYPGVHIDKLMEKCRPEVIKMFVEVPEEHETLVDTVLGPSVLKNLSNGKDVEAPTWSWAAYKKESACDAERRTINPGIASDKNGKWMVIVQTNDMPQRIHTEVCRNQGGACKAMSDCGKNSRCTQKYSWHLLIAMDQDEPDSCPRMAAFRFPTSCVCHIEIDKPRLLRSPPMSKKVDYHEDYEVIESEESLRADI